MNQSFDEVDDLTRFADESFDTEDIDLFEFTGNDDSPLTRLKSIILSLDWEITDDILDELAEEVAALGEMWNDDKVAQVYLQGIDKVGKYLRIEGAYAHPNAIKLLLTLFYNFEKIISSPDISGDEITSLLKADIRKFKVLQYQIGQTKGVAVAPAAQKVEKTETQVAEEFEPLTSMEATILSLDWEVTEEGLEKFTRQAELVREHLKDNKHALVLVQGLQAIAGYISDERSKAHPDAFTLMHSFYDGLKRLVYDETLDSETRQGIIIQGVSQLNNLKEIIAGNVPAQEAVESADNDDEILEFQETEEEPDDIESAEEEPIEITDEEEPAPTGEELDFDFGLEETEEESGSADEEAIEIADEEEPAPTGEELDFDFGLEETEEESVSADEEAIEIADEEEPAPTGEELDFDFGLEETEEESGSADEEAIEIADEEEPAPAGEELDFDFGLEETETAEEQPAEPQQELDEEEKTSTVSSAMETADEQYPDDILDPAAIHPLSDEIADEFIEEELNLSSGSSAALGVSDDESLDVASTAEDTDIEEELELLFTGEGEEEDVNLAAQEGETNFDELELNFDEESEAEAKTSGPDIAEALTDIEENESLDFDQELLVAEDEVDAEHDESSVTPALEDAAEKDLSPEHVGGSESRDESSSELEDKLDSFFGLTEEEQQPEAIAEQETTPELEEETITPALDDATEESGFREEQEVETLEEGPSAELEDKLDSFFGLTEEEEQPEAIAEQETAPVVEEEETIAPALDDATEESGFSEDQEVETLEEGPSAELEDKLDSFFGLSEEEEQPEALAEQETAPELEEEETIAPALDDATEESGFSEDQEVETLEEGPSAELEDKLDSFFELTEEEEQPEAVVEQETEPEVEEEEAFAPALEEATEESGFSEEQEAETLEEGPSVELDDKLDSFFAISGEEEELSGEETEKAVAGHTAVASLTAAAAAFVAAPSADSAAAISDITTAAQSEDLSDNQLVLLSLIDSATALLAAAPQYAADHSEIVSGLVAEVENSDQPGILVAAVARYTAWQQQYFKSIAAVPPEVAQADSGESVVEKEGIIAQVNAGFEQLRQSIKQEFDALKKEIE